MKLGTEEEERKLNLCKVILARYSITFDINKVRSKSRKAELVFKRSLICFILKKEKLSFSKIGKYINRDHATAMNLLKFDMVRVGKKTDSIQFSKRTSNKKFIKLWREITTSIDSASDEVSILSQIEYHEGLIKALKEQLKLMKVKK